MKATQLLLLAVLALAGFAATPTAQAHERYRCASSSCAPYKVRTCEVSRCCYQRTGYDDCGYRYRYNVTAVTYRTYYSDGTSRTFTRTYRS